MMYCALRKTEIASEITVGKPPRRMLIGSYVLHVRALENVMYFR
jgi:hypothetical protein